MIESTGMDTDPELGFRAAATSADTIYWPDIQLSDYDFSEPSWDSLIRLDWQEPKRNPDIQEGKVTIPEGSKPIATRTWTTVYRNEARAIRVVNWGGLGSHDEQEYARNDARYKVLVAKHDVTNLTPSIFVYDPESGSINMEYVEGTPLSMLDSRIKIPAAVVERFFDRLERFHQLGLFHGDLSDTSHYIITPAGEIRLIDPSFMRDTTDEEQIKKMQEIDRAMAKKILNQFSETKID